MEIKLKRINEAVHLVAQNEDGNEVHIDGADKIGGEGKGARPMQLLIMGLGGCSSMDLLSILKKQRQHVVDYEVKIKADRDQENTPSLFTDIHVQFILKGEIDEAKARRAVNLSMEKYCSVTKILEKTANITYDIVLNGEELG